MGKYSYPMRVGIKAMNKWINKINFTEIILTKKQGTFYWYLIKWNRLVRLINPDQILLCFESKISWNRENTQKAVILAELAFVQIQIFIKLPGTED